MTDFVYPEGYQLFAGVDEVGRGPLVWRSCHGCGDLRSE